MFDKRYRRYVQSFLLVLPMTGIVTATNTLVAKNLAALLTMATLQKWAISLVVAFPCVLFMAPFAAKIAEHLTRDKHHD